MSALLNPLAAGPQREVHLRDYWKIVWQGRWTVAGVFLLVVVGTAGWTFLQTPIYRATATVEVQPQARRIAPGQDVSGIGVAGYGWFAEEKYQNTQLEIIRSRAIAERAFQALGLASDERFAGARDPIGAFQGLIRVEPRRQTGLVDISISGPDPAEIARWVNAVADNYVERNIESARANTLSAVKKLEEMMQPLKSKLQDAETSRLDVLKETEIYNPENQAQIVKQKLEKLNGELQTVQIEIARLGAVLAKVDELRSGGADPMSIPELAADSVIQDLNKQKIDVERQLETTRVTFRPGAPAYQEKVSELEKIKVRIRDQIALVLGNIGNRHELATRNRDNLVRQIQIAEDESLRVGVATSKYRLVETDAATKQQIYQAIMKTLNEITLGADLLANNVTLLDHAITPLRPIKPNKRISLVLGAMLGFLLGVGTVFFLDYLDNTLRSPEDIEKYLHLTTLAVVPKFTEAERSAHAVKEAYQTLRTSLIFSSKNRERKVVLITSTGPQEGKSSTVAQLARTLASAGERVIVLDCDLRRPTQHFHLKLERDGGLTNYLVAPRGMDDWAPFVKTVGPVNLHAMTCGPIPPNPPDLLGSDRFRRLVDDLRGGYDWVLIDSPPAMSLSDAVLLSSLADMVLLVIRHNATDRDHVLRTTQVFRNVSANIVGAVLNSVDLDRAYKKDYYYAGYYYDERKRDGSKRPGEAEDEKAGASGDSRRRRSAGGHGGGDEAVGGRRG